MSISIDKKEKSATLKEQFENCRNGSMSKEYEELEDEEYEADFEEGAADVSDEEDF